MFLCGTRTLEREEKNTYLAARNASVKSVLITAAGFALAPCARFSGAVARRQQTVGGYGASDFKIFSKIAVFLELIITYDLIAVPGDTH